MKTPRQVKVHRRRFLQQAGMTAALGTVAVRIPRAAGRNLSIVADPADAVASSAPAVWAARELETALQGQGVEVRRYARITEAPGTDLCLVIGGSAQQACRQVLTSAGADVPAVAEALALAPGQLSGRRVLLACGHDARGLVYALMELCDRVRHESDAMAALNIPKPVVETPANLIRSVARLFVSEVEDKPWFYDREMWPRYLTMLAAHRYNRFNLSLGIGYDFLNNVTDAYFLFAYPFLLAVPGYAVKASGLPDAERDRNLETLKFIGAETVARGMQFQLGVWMHGYEWIKSPNANYTIEGLSGENHARYCRDALLALLKACPSISGITFRIHGESGVPEGNYDLWKTIFEGVSGCGRTVEIDMHAKGMDDGMTEVALATGMPVNISPKYWAEHLGMPYHQAEIRELERPRPGNEASGLMRLSAGSRSFLRYGYGDLLKEDRRYGVLHRVWPGTQRLLLSGDPVTAAAYGRAFSFCGSVGAEIMEPLSFKGRRGSGIAGDRCGYLDASLKPRWDWEKYDYPLRLWGRMMYNPDADPDVWGRSLRKQFGSAARETGEALAQASRILPTVTTAHGASAANNVYWVEMYTNQPIVDSKRLNPYTDSPAPRVFGNVSPLDPQLFAGINGFADELLDAGRTGKYSPIEVAQWLEDYADAAARHLSQAEAQVPNKSRPEWRRLAIDVAMQIGLGRFYGAKLRSGVLYALFERSGDRAALENALKLYRQARAHWADLAQRAKGAYLPDVTVGPEAYIRGHWFDRLPAIDDDIADMAARFENAAAGKNPPERSAAAIKEALGHPERASLPCRHTPPRAFRPGAPIELTLLPTRSEGVSARLYYRHVNQAERFAAIPMQRNGSGFRASIPGTYTLSPYPIQYYFVWHLGDGKAGLHPGLGASLTDQPYFVVRRTSA
jgi:hypothetical protein